MFLTPVMIGYAFFRDRLEMSVLDLSALRLDAGTMLVGILLLAGGGRAVHRGAGGDRGDHAHRQGAGVIFGPLIFAMLIPFDILSLIISEPRAQIVQVFTHFPLTAPVTAMLRSAFGTLAPVTAEIVIVELFGPGALVLRAAVDLIRYGAIAYTDKLDLRATLGRRPVTAGR